MEHTPVELGALNVPAEVSNDYALLQDLLSSFAQPADNPENADYYTTSDFELWKTGFLNNFEPVNAAEVAAIAEAPIYTVTRIEQQSGNRSFGVNLNVDNSFGAEIIARIQGQVSTMISRMLQGQLNAFIARAISINGLERRRNRSLAFPFTLPYITPRPTTLRGRAAEEAAILEAAINYVFTRRTENSFGVYLYINRRSRDRNRNGKWTTGWADVNSYNRQRYLNIYLNDRAFPQFGDNNWTSTIAHEILHNLGWGHGSGNYDRRNVIEIYQFCIRNAQGLIAAVENEAELLEA